MFVRIFVFLSRVQIFEITRYSTKHDNDIPNDMYYNSYYTNYKWEVGRWSEVIVDLFYFIFFNFIEEALIVSSYVCVYVYSAVEAVQPALSLDKWYAEIDSVGRTSYNAIMERSPRSI